MRPILLPRHETEQPSVGTVMPSGNYHQANAEALLKFAPTIAKQLPFVREALSKLPAGGQAAVNAVMGGELRPLEVAYSGLLGQAATMASQALGVPVGDLLTANTSEARKTNPNFKASTALSGARTIAGMAGRPLSQSPALAI